VRFDFEGVLGPLKYKREVITFLEHSGLKVDFALIHEKENMAEREEMKL
jgi:hypothetical protein